MSQRESKGVRRPNNSGETPGKGLIVNGLVQGIGPCTFETNWEIGPIPSESGAGSESGFGSSGFGSPASLG